MITIVGSQSREPIEDTEYVVAAKINDEISDEVLLREKTEDSSFELWSRNDDFAGYTIVIDGKGYEFIRSARQGDLWWFGIDNNIDWLDWQLWLKQQNPDTRLKDNQ
jgi:hypothetical protein